MPGEELLPGSAGTAGMLSLDPAESTLLSFPSPGEATVAPWTSDIPGKQALEDGLSGATLPAQHATVILIPAFCCSLSRA